MKRKNHFVLFGILLLALINLSPSSLPVASNSGAPRDSDDGSTALQEGESERPLREIEVYTMMGAAEFKALQTINEEYRRRSGADVTLVNIAPEQAYKTYREAYAAGREPDVLMLDGAWVAEFAAAGRLLPADLYESNMAAAADSLPLPAESVEWNGYRWAVPLDYDPYGIAWNPGRFAAASGGLPQSQQAWQAWEKSQLQPRDPRPSAESKAGPEEEASAGQGSESRSAALADEIIGLPAGDVRAFSALVDLWKGKEEGSNAERLKRALQLADELRTRTYLHDLSLTGGQSPVSLRTKVESGQLALAVDRLSRLGAENLPGSRVAPLAGPIEIASLRCFGIAADTERSREASLWIAYVTGRSTQSDWYGLTGHLPVLRSVYDEPDNAPLLSWIPDLQALRAAEDNEAGTGRNAKKTASRENTWSRSLDRFYEGRLDADGLAAYFLP
ncbi:hypothetical protein CDO73_15045 [Saccharibacillus sp. O23]|uniref:ABC transporter substrate-binding protein n=1 Tax=Saccharibacillus sp. O23 TaxID=2009338 RepID=UPI000B4E8253|nr:extracellular solute-binding protein [Saccharibacillus sp. O23]OWR29505.1 hypothetical protein CDO73_15045 [Saccharibacillus sp. O23]